MPIDSVSALIAALCCPLIATNNNFTLASLEDVVLLAVFALCDDINTGAIAFQLHGVDDRLQRRLVQILGQEGLFEAVEQLNSVLFALWVGWWGERFHIVLVVSVKYDL